MRDESQLCFCLFHFVNRSLNILKEVDQAHQFLEHNIDAYLEPAVYYT